MKTIKSLEFNLIRDDLSNYAFNNLTKQKILNLELINNSDLLKQELIKTDEASKILLSYGNIIMEELNDIYASVDKANKGSVLNIDELYDIKRSFILVKENKNFSKMVKLEDFPMFSYILKYLNNCPEIENALNKTIDNNKTILDSASSKLKEIRIEIKKLENEIKEKLLKLINTYSAILSDTNIIYKNGKQVLAVQSIHKHKLGGVIVEESNSGYTSYVEPEAVYKITSKINILKSEEKEEILKILTDLSRKVAKYGNEIRTNFEEILELDFMFAKGNYANKNNSKVATLSDNTLKLVKAKHPLIDKEKVISNDFYLSDENKKILLISGPNTGGKSVALKTVGILSYMNQCGLAIPVDGEAILPVFDNIYVDIGDNQSIISSLSTFSSHISNIAYILENITNKSLVLLDEIGAGTSPKEGEGLAMAIIDYCHQKECFLLTSTHYDNLKTFALNQDYIQVSSMEFDKVNLKPTYHLLKNQIGKSYALEIANRYNLKKEVINKAYTYIDEYASETERTLKRLESKLEEQLEIIKLYESKKEELDKLIEENKLKEQFLDREKERIKEEADLEIEEIIKDKKQEIKDIIEEIKNKDNLKVHEALIASKKLDNLIEKEEEKKESENFKINDDVKIVSLEKTGKIVSVNKNKYGVNIGNLTINVDGSDLIKIKVKEKNSKVIISSKVKISKMSSELNLIGKRVEEALKELEIYLDKARVLHLSSVRIIHGYGTGKLQKAIHEYLKKDNSLTYHFGGENDGGMGSTIVEFGIKGK